MKIVVYNYREFDEGKYFDRFGKLYNVEIIKCCDTPNLENAKLALNCHGVSVITTVISKDIIKLWHDLGVKHISTRTIGYDHIDIEAAKKYNIPFYYYDFREGWQNGIDISKELEIYRQNYCGCIYSEEDRFLSQLSKKYAKKYEEINEYYESIK